MSLRTEMLVESNGVQLCVQTFGDPSDAAILLIMGSSASMDWWEDEFCERLAAASRYVIRYDQRDTGRSVSYEPGAPPYSMSDLAVDALGLLDCLYPRPAHLAGMSMGGAIAQMIALEHPDRVASLILISSSPVGGGDADLAAMSEETAAAFAVEEPNWSDREAVIDYISRLGRVSASRSRPFDEVGFRALARRAIDRSTNIASSMTNHNAIVGEGPPATALQEVAAPTLVIHGTDDPVLPIAHGIALAKAIPRARLVPLEQTGHELPREVWDVVVAEVLAHTSSTPEGTRG